MKQQAKSLSNSLIGALLSVALLGTMGVTQAQQAKSNDNWQSGGTQLRSGADSSLCWRDANWTPATAAADCDGALKPPAPAPAPRAAAPAPAQKAAPAAPAPAVTSTKVTLLSDALFDFDKSVIKPEGTKKLADLTAKLKGVTVEVIIVIGYTDSVGSLKYNKALSLRRAEAVKAFLVKNGVEANRVYTEGKAFADPVGDNKTAAGRALNRRTVVEVVGTRPVGK
jgi:OOP family OmpA-OmpF porin